MRVGRKVCRDHLGVEYASVSEMAREWGMLVATVDSRLRRGWSMERALTEPTGRGAVTDHEGREFKSISDMARFWGKDCNVVNWRLKNGWSVEDALLVEVAEHSHECVDHLGREFQSVSAMCDANYMSESNFYKWRKAGKSVEEIFRGVVS